MTTDVDGAKRFYTSLSGWSTQPFEFSTPGQPYTMFVQDGTPIGGVMAMPPEQRQRGVPSFWLPSVEVSDVDAWAKQAETLGGKVHMAPSDVPGTGRYAVLQDPQGAFIAIFKPAGGPMDSSFDGTPQPGRVSWHELMTTDQKKAAEFYRRLFGWEKMGEFEMGPGASYYEFGQNGKMYGGMFSRPAEMAGVPPFWLTYIFVSDLKASLDKAKKAGAKVVNGPMDIPGGGSIVVLADPQGAGIALHSTKPWAQAATPTAKSKPAKSKPKAKSRPKARAQKKPKKAARKVKPKAKPKAMPKARAKKAKKKARRR
jgi:predicted enzyme related to lactoylglutathione lyase